MEDIMKTLWDESSDLDAAGMNERSIDSDDYTTDDSMEAEDLQEDEMDDVDKIIDPDELKKKEDAKNADKK